MLVIASDFHIEIPKIINKTISNVNKAKLILQKSELVAHNMNYFIFG